MGINPPFIDIRDISKQFGDHHALRHVSLQLHRGEVVALLGANGAGKTTLSALLATVHAPTSGDILCNGTSIFSDVIAYRRIVGYCPQRSHGDRTFTVRELLWYAGEFFGLTPEAIAQRIDEVVRLCALHEVLDRIPGDLSGGYRQRFNLARALMHDPQLVIMDEPTVALDPHVRRKIWALIQELRSRGVTILLTTHYLDEAELLSDRVCFLDHGVVKRFGTPDELRTAYGAGRLEDIFMRMMEEAEQA